MLAMQYENSSPPTRVHDALVIDGGEHEACDAGTHLAR
jgi:hypothetical protein